MLLDITRIKEEIVQYIIEYPQFANTSALLENVIYKAITKVHKTIPRTFKIGYINRVDIKETINNIRSKFEVEKYAYLIYDKKEYIYYNNKFIILEDEIYSIEEIDFSEYIVQFTPKSTIYYVLNGPYGLETKPLKLTFYDSVYINPDFNRTKVENFINSDKSGLILFNGDPGTGKTSIIKDFINKSNGRTFLYMNARLLTDITSSNFITFLEEHKDAIIVFEDCEEMLASRSNSYNPLISTVLNLSDGMLGENFKIKFICTLNCPEADIDEALLRKGRLFYKYEFKPLEKEVVAKVFKDFNIEAEPKSMTLAEAVNYSIDNNSVKQKRNKIGF